MAEELAGGTTLKTTKTIAGIISLIYSMDGGKTAEDFFKAYSAQSLANYTKFGLQKTTNESDNELVFGLYKSAVKNYLNFCIKLADIKDFNYANKNKFKQLKAAAELHSNLIDSFCTYEQMIEEAKTLASGQALEDYIPDYTADKYNLSARYNTKTGKFEVIKTTSSSAGVSENDQIDKDDYVVIPAAFEDNKVILIADHGFEGITNKKGVVFPDTIESVGDYSFSDSTGLISVTLNQNLQSIGTGAFKNCTSLLTWQLNNRQ